MPRLIPSIVLAVVLLAGSAASAVTLASRFTALSDEVAERIAAFPDSGLSKDEKKIKSSLGKAAKALAKDTDDLAKTLKNGRKAVSKLDLAYPADGVLAPLLDDVVAGLSLDVTKRGGELFVSIQGLPDGTAKTKAQTLSDASEAEIVAAADEPIRADKIAHFSAANTLIAKGERVVRKAGGGGGGGGGSTNELDVDIGAEHLHLPPATGDFVYTVTYDAGGNALVLAARGVIGTTTHAFSLRVAAPALGSQQIQGGPQTTYTSSAIAAQPPFVLQPPATMNLTTFDTVQSKFAGTFSATFTNGTTTVTLANGTFDQTN